ncbi:MAG: hypothetical protein NC409_12450 [Clostridium sp.]|nr:hypothetical protein [Clostridium sp.]
MRLWVDGKPGSPDMAIRATIKEQTENINRKVLSRGVRAVNALRNAELEVLKGKRNGKVYRKYPYKSKYRASAPGEPPARRTGNLRMHWTGNVATKPKSDGGVTVTAELESQESYASVLENGRHGMAPRPFVQPIIKKAMPEIRRIFSEPYT